MRVDECLLLEVSSLNLALMEVPMHFRADRQMITRKGIERASRQEHLAHKMYARDETW